MQDRASPRANARTNFGALPLAAQFFMMSLAGTVSGIILAKLGSRGIAAAATFDLSSFIDPEAVSDIAAEFPSDVDDFALAAWEFCYSEITYSGYGSFLRFYDTTIVCEKCLLPEAVLRAGVANCVGMSVVMTSLLRNVVGPDQVRLVIGDYIRNGSTTGHAWVELKRSGTWYVIEPTMEPPQQPWVPSSDVSMIYVGEVFLSDQGVLCYSDEFCPTESFNIAAQPCTCHL